MTKETKKPNIKDDTITQNTEETGTERPNNSTSHHDMKWSSAKNIPEKITISIDQNHTLQEKQDNESTKKEEKWIRVQNGIKQTTYELE